MPNPQTKKEIARSVKPVLDELHLHADTAPNNFDDLNARMSYYANWRQSHEALGRTEPMNSLKSWGGKLHRIAAYYLDDSGTAQAQKYNEDLYRSISTEEGMRAFANRVARDLLRIDVKKAFFTGTPEEAAEIYAQNPRECELGWVSLDLVQDASDMLDPDVARAVSDRVPALQGMAIYRSGAAVVGSKFYGIVPDITDETLKRHQKLEGDDFYDTDEMNANPDVKELTTYIDNCGYYRDLVTGKAKETSEAGRDLMETVDVDVSTVFTDDQGNRISYLNAIQRYAKHEAVNAQRLPSRAELADGQANQPTRDAIVNLVRMTDAEKAIHMPTSDNPALHDQFGTNVLKAQGKGLMNEYRNLWAIMENATYWYAAGSKEFREMRKELKRLGHGDRIPNRQECQESMDKILAYAEKYVADKRGLTLKPREQKRLDAVVAVLDSLTPRRDILARIRQNAEAQRQKSYNESGKDASSGPASLENQTRYHVNKFEQTVATCYSLAVKCASEPNAMGDLASSSAETLNYLREYAVAPGWDPDQKGMIFKDEFPRKLAEVAVFEVLHAERQSGAETCPIADHFDELRKNPDAWNKLIDDISKTDTIKKAVADIRKDPANSVGYLGENGKGTLVDGLLKEAAAANAKKAQAAKQVVAAEKQEVQVKPNEINVPVKN